MFRCLIAKLLLCGCQSFIKESYLLTYHGYVSNDASNRNYRRTQTRNETSPPKGAGRTAQDLWKRTGSQPDTTTVGHNYGH